MEGGSGVCSVCGSGSSECKKKEKSAAKQ